MGKVVMEKSRWRSGDGEVVMENVERDLELLGAMGVEGKLQKDVKPSLEVLRNAKTFLKSKADITWGITLALIL